MITFVSASAGSGKTHRVTGEVVQRLADGVCRPAGLIATTFTRKAAGELEDRIRETLYRKGRIELAEALDAACIGTVHSVAGRFHRRFAFEAGLSPRIEILEPTEAAALFSRAVEEVADLETLSSLDRLSRSLGQLDSRTRGPFWKGQVQKIVDACRTNDLGPEMLPGFAQSSAEEVIAGLAPESAADLDAVLLGAIGACREAICGNGDETEATRKFARRIASAAEALEHGELPWSEWLALGKEKAGRTSEFAALLVQTAAATVEGHPRLRSEIRAYSEAVFGLAARALDRFQALKTERGLLDYADLEQRAYRLLRDHAPVRDVLRAELDLVVVDEFQDTSPIQMALFLELARLARETLWVGDVKQSIYGFRASDPELVEAVLHGFDGLGGRREEPLSTSWRSAPDLVLLGSEVFVPAFQRALGLPEAEVRLHPDPERVTASGHAVESCLLSSGQYTKAKPQRLKGLTGVDFAQVLADAVQVQLRDGAQVVDRDTRTPRGVIPRDVAVLCRTNAAAAAVAEVLRGRGVPVLLAGAGLLTTPEACLAMACLRRFADPVDTLAAAEIVALTAEGGIEEWLERRIAHVEATVELEPGPERWGLEEPFVHPILLALDQRRSRLVLLSPSEALDESIAAGDLFRSVSAWGPDASRAAQRRANLEALRASASTYEAACESQHVPATIAGFLFWLEDRKAGGSDSRASDPNTNAVHVGTYHAAKGLEWPVVMLCNLDDTSRPRLWEVTTHRADSSVDMDLGSILGDRRVRFWVWPFGQQKTGIPMADRLASGPVGAAAAQAARQEDLRLLYVGMTRARDRLVLVRDEAALTDWLDLLEAPWILREGEALLSPTGHAIPVACRRLQLKSVTGLAPEPGTVCWFSHPTPPAPRQDASVAPSAQAPLASGRAGRIIEFGGRLPCSGSPAEVNFGDALHAVLAADAVNRDRPDRLEMAHRIIAGHGLSPNLRAEDVLVQMDRFWATVDTLFKPRSAEVEVPFSYSLPSGQRVAGIIDLLLETEAGWVILDHKSYPGPRSEWASRALRYSGQLELYRLAIKATGRKPADLWIHFAVGGGLVEILSASDSEGGR